MLTVSKTVPFTSHRVRKNPFRDHLHSGKKCWGNLDFSLVGTDSMFPVCMLFPSTISHSCVKKFQILTKFTDFSIKYRLPNAYKCGRYYTFRYSNSNRNNKTRNEIEDEKENEIVRI